MNFLFCLVFDFTWKFSKVKTFLELNSVCINVEVVMWSIIRHKFDMYALCVEYNNFHSLTINELSDNFSVLFM